MIPRTFPSVFGTAGETKMVVYVLPSITGLQAWKDYIPVKGVTSESNVLQNTYNNGGYQVMNALDSITGKQAWKDYIPVYEDAAYNKPWSTDAGGYIPGAGLFSVLGSLFANNEQGAWYDPSDIDLTWRRNLLTRTEEFDNAAWTKLNAAITANANTAPDGTSTADKFINNASGAYVYYSAPVSSGNNTLSVYAKAGEKSQLHLERAGGVSAQFNLVTGTVIQTAGGASAVVYSVNDGWYRCVMTFAETSSALVNVYIGRTSGGSDGTSGIYIWGAQLEAGSTASAYQRITDGVQDYFVADPQPVLFQDSAGTTPVTAVEQPVGLVLDKRKGLVLGSDVVVNGSFATDTVWSKGTGWTITGGAAVGVNAGNMAQAGILTIGKWYRADVTVSVYTSGTLVCGTISNQKTLPSGTGVKTVYFLADATTFYFVGGSSFNGSVDVVTVRELPGNHAYQSTSASRPVLSARVNLLTKTEQFDDAAWSYRLYNNLVLGTRTANQEIAPDGTLTADLLTMAASRGVFNRVSVAPNTTYTFSCYAKQTGASSACQFSIAEGDASNNFIKQSISNIEANATSWVVYQKTITTSATTASVEVGFASGGGTVNIYVWGADLRVSNVGAGLPSYQRVNTATDYDTVGFPKYLKFDGVDDFLVTNSIDFSATDKMTVVAGVRKLSDAATGVLLELGTNAYSSPGFNIFAPRDGLDDSYGFALYQTASAGYKAEPFASPITSVLACLFDYAGATVADEVKPRVNGTVPSLTVQTTGPAGTGNFPNAALYVGRRAGSSLPFNGHLYGLIVRGAASSSFQISGSEKYMNGVTKAY